MLIKYLYTYRIGGQYHHISFFRTFKIISSVIFWHVQYLSSDCFISYFFLTDICLIFLFIFYFLGLATSLRIFGMLLMKDINHKNKKKPFILGLF